MFIREEKWALLMEDLFKPAKCAKHATGDHPKVVAAIIKENGDKLIMESHYDDGNNPVCIHAEEKAIKELLICKKSFRTDKLIFYTTLEPCNQRDQLKIPCAHRVATMEFSEVHIGMLDPDPNIFGRGIMYLIRNFNRKNVYYAPPLIRNLIWQENLKFINYREQRFSFDMFKEKFPIFTGDDEENYLKWAHALFRMFRGEKIVWLFPRFPTFLDKHKFQATWAEGMLNAKGIKSIELLVHKNEWAKDISDAVEEPEMCDILKKEFSNLPQIDIKLFLIECEDCLCEDFKGAIFYNKQKRIDCLIVPSYNSEKNRVPMFLVCTPNYYAQRFCDKQTQEDINNYWNKVESKYKSIMTKTEPIDFHKRLLEDLSKQNK